MLIGLQGSGKSTYLRQRGLDRSHAVLSKDNWPNARHKEQRQCIQLAALLEAGRNVVVDNTNASAQERASILRIAKEHGAVLRAIFFEVDLKTCLARNDTRSGRKRVPLVGVYATAKRLEAPTLAEGFDSVEVVGQSGADLPAGDSLAYEQEMTTSLPGLRSPGRRGR